MLHSAPIELAGNDVILRKTIASDAEYVFEAVIETQEFLFPRMRWAAAIPDRRNAVEHCQQAELDWESGVALNYTIWSYQGALLGKCSLHHIDWGVPKFEVGYWIRRSCHGKGIATEATKLMTEMAFGKLLARRVSLWCAVDNLASQRVAEKLDFAKEGTLANDEIDALGRPVDMIVYGRTK